MNDRPFSDPRTLEALTRAFVLCASILLPLGCGGRPRIYETPTQGAYAAEITGLDLSLLTELVVQTRFGDGKLPPPNQIYVELRFSGKEFEQVHILANDEVHTLRRALFHTSRANTSLEDFLRIGSARTLAFRFDNDPKIFQLDEEDARALRRFTAGLDYHYDRLRQRAESEDRANRPSDLSTR